MKLVGLVVGEKFRLTACIGIGGSGAVYKADQIALGRTVAVKLLNEDLSSSARMVQRFHDEALAASRLNHPNTVSIIDYGQTPEGLLYLAMEYVRGPTLTQLLVKESPLGVERVLDIIEQTLAGIEEAHLAGVVHADLKADNILLDQRRAGVDIVKIVDFGIARIVNGPGDGEDRSICGTPEYMAPEVIDGSPPGFPADVYAVGVILYELLVKETPFFAASTAEILSNHLEARRVPLTKRREDAPRELDEVLDRALARDVRHRYAEAAEMRAAVAAVRAKLRGAGPKEHCASCGAACPPRFKFCSDCGAPRVRFSLSQEIPTIPGALPGGGLGPGAASLGTATFGPPTPFPAAPVAAAVASAPPTRPLHAPAEEHPPFGLPFTGRAAVLASVLEHLRRPRGADCGLLLIGRDGVGRSAVLRHARLQLGAAGPQVIIVGADPTGLARTYHPVRELLARLLGVAPGAGRDALTAGVARVGATERDAVGVVQLFGHDTALRGLDPHTLQRELTRALLGVLEAAGGARDLAIVFDDADRYDSPSLELVRAATDSADALLPPVVVIASEALGAAWSPGVNRVEVPPLPAPELGALVARLAQVGVKGLPPAQALFEATAGFPSHLDHLVSFLLEGGRMGDAAGRLGDLIAARLSLLSRQTLEVLQLAAVLGLEPEPDLLAEMTSPTALDAALEDLTARGLLVMDLDRGLSFASRLVRDVAYEAIPADVRRAQHAAAAAALATRSAEPTRRGHHHDLAGQVRPAVPLLHEAGDRAAAQLDDTCASRCYRRALLGVRQLIHTGYDETLGEETFVALSVKLAESLRARGEGQLARGILAEARGWAGRGRLAARIDRALAGICAAEGDADGAIAALGRGVGRAVRDSDFELVCELYLDLARALTLAGDPDGAARELVECVDLVTLGEGVAARGGPQGLWRIVRALAQAVNSLGDTYRAMRLAEAALFHARRAGEAMGAARVQQLLSMLCEREGLVEDGDRHREAAIADLRALGDRRPTGELLLGETPARSVVVVTNRVADFAQVAVGFGWTDGQDRAWAERRAAE